MHSVLGAAELSRPAAVRGVVLLGAQLGEDLGGTLTRSGRLLLEALLAVLVAIAAPAVGQGCAAVPACVRQRREVGPGRALPAIGQPFVQRRAMMRAR